MRTTDLQHFRSEKDHFFKHGDQSPLTPEARNDFVGLHYFDPNPSLIYDVSLEATEPTEVVIGTTTGDERTYVKVAHATINVDDETARVALYSTGHDSLFLPFRDSTSGRETYGAGRYIDVQPNSDGTAVIDFNYAYAPFCAYNDGISCALPPAENWMSVAIRAGERLSVTTREGVE